VWDDEKLDELLASKSGFLGNAILGQFPIAAPRSNGFARLPQSTPSYELLIDGLQRFSIGTALLSILHPLVLANNPLNSVAAPFFSPLRTFAASLAPIYQHNDNELQNHSRQAVSESYIAFRATLGNFLLDEVKSRPSHIAESIQHLFLERQIAPDTYYGFGSPAEIVGTFIGLNTIRVQLNIVDWLRSLIIEKGARNGWTTAEIEDAENHFSEVFLDDKGTAPESELMPLAAIIKDAIVEPAPSGTPMRVFPSWSTQLAVTEVRDFLDFVSNLAASNSNPYFSEIKNCGAIPLASCICFYYRRFLTTNAIPSFVNGGLNEDDELRAFLRANYRVLLDGRIGRTRTYAEALIRSTSPDLIATSNQISRDFLGYDLSVPVNRDWLTASLRKSDVRRSMRVFNACLLSELGMPPSFQIQQYGKKSAHYQIDHLIPKSARLKNLPGDVEIDLISNFAPIRRTANNGQSNLACSSKLAPGGNFAAEVANDAQVHPYVEWLVNNQGVYGSQLDRQELLLSNASPRWAQDRIDCLVNTLETRL